MKWNEPDVWIAPWYLRVPIALVWLYQGLWCKVLGGVPRHEAVLGSVPSFTPEFTHGLLIALGLFETGLAIWVLTGRRLRLAALVQTALLVGMNSGGLIWARHIIPDPAGMVFSNLVLVTLIWVVAVGVEPRRRLI